jgi:hypothetical protein
MPDGTFVNAIRDLADAKVLTQEVNGLLYSTAALRPIMPPSSSTLTVHTLTGVRDYLTANRDKLDLTRVMVHVISPDTVRVLNPIRDSSRDRECLLESVALLPGLIYGNYMGQEEFLIHLSTHFYPTTLLEELRSSASQIVSSEEVALDDDGVTQRATLQAGVTRKRNATLPPIMLLQPYRTFLEVRQPESPFLLRIKRSEDGVKLALFEADGGQWRNQAIEDVGLWLQEQLPTGIAVLA